MSRIGKLPVIIPTGVEVTLNLPQVTVKGAKGSLEVKLPRGIVVEQKDQALVVEPTKRLENKAMFGLSRTLLQNAIAGVSEGFSKRLEIHGVGYKAKIDGNKLTLNVGLSHPIEYKLPESIEAQIAANVITISGISKQLVGQVAAEIRAFRKPEPYKGKGIKYQDEHVRRKAGKAAAAAGGAK